MLIPLPLPVPTAQAYRGTWGELTSLSQYLNTDQDISTLRPRPSPSLTPTMYHLAKGLYRLATSKEGKLSAPHPTNSIPKDPH